MSTPIIDLDSDVFPVKNGWRVQRPDGTALTVLKRPSEDGWAVFTGTSTDTAREPILGFAGSWRRHPEAAIEWARTETQS